MKKEWHLLLAGVLSVLSACVTEPIDASEAVGTGASQPASPRATAARIEIDPGSRDFSMSSGTGMGIVRRDCYQLAVEAAEEVFSLLFSEVATPGEEPTEASWRILVRYDVGSNVFNTKVEAILKVALYPPGESEPVSVLEGAGSQINYSNAYDPAIRNALLRGYGDIARQITDQELLIESRSPAG